MDQQTATTQAWRERVWLPRPGTEAELTQRIEYIEAKLKRLAMPRTPVERKMHTFWTNKLTRSRAMLAALRDGDPCAWPEYAIRLRRG